MDIDKADYHKTHVAEDYGTEDVGDNGDDDPMTASRWWCDSPFLASHFDADTKMAHLGHQTDTRALVLDRWMPSQ